ncbi:alkaline phosphatase D family protein [Lignipirellula cremea]|uniref:PhoD-like phosphatase n=1 Tax=Lignipirellula cremea TaxID=2528010 RepID=A0A518E4J3_9BACT|nr:alkaline phosphatase D family protein [Lignipirellula cremea]QDU99009.1 PhoD-like phosphatase [Lignipirellula cremea]
MRNDPDRRTVLKLAAAASAVVSVGASRADGAGAAEVEVADAWSKTHDRVWLGGDYWANPMEDWRIVDGAAECQNLGGNRSVHSLTHQITRPDQGFRMTVRVEQVETKGKDAGAGFRIGVRSDINEHRSNCFAGNGLNAGVRDGQLVLGPKQAPLKDAAGLKAFDLLLTAVAQDDKVALTLEAMSPESGASLGKVSYLAPGDALLGNVALVSNYSPPQRRGAKQPPAARSRYRFRSWQMEGDAFTVSPAQRFGPLLWSMYSLSDSRSKEGFVMKISALTGPLGAQDNQTVELLIQTGDDWKSLGEAKLDPDAWVAAFRVPNWDESKATPYKLVYREKHTDGSETPDEWTGTIQANPAGRPLRMATLTCQNDYAFPYEPVVRNLARLKPDLMLFSGDQLYENHGGFGIIREPADPAILNYLRKFYQFGWAFRSVMCDQPTLCLPDDHDVFQGNIWGEGGAKMNQGDSGASSKGGYAQPAKMVNVVHRTNVGHHPDPFDATPCLQDISVYFGDMVYGGVSFGIIGDRQWKSGPERVDTGSGRADHVLDPKFDCRTLDKPGLVLLGERQEAFLKHWAEDWRGHTLKALLSQTVFAGVATHHGSYDGYLKGDLDSGAWPQTPRRRAVDILRPAMALHINGDQHLTTLCQYGGGEQRDSSWSFCPPAVAVGYPRWWRPDEVGMEHANRPKHGLANTGEFVDTFGNNVYVYAVGNPEVGRAPNRYDRAHEKGSGFGMVTFDVDKKTYHIESFRFLVDASDGKPGNQFPGWPLTIHQAENRGENQIG